MSSWTSFDAHASSRNGWSKPSHREWSARAASPPRTAAASLSNGSEDDEYDELESMPSRTTSPVLTKTKEPEARPTLHPLFFPPVVNNNTNSMSSSIFSGKTSIYDLDRSRHGSGIADSLRLPPLRLPGSPLEHPSALQPTFLTYRLPPISPISPLSSSSTSASVASSSSRATQHLSPNLKPSHYHPYPPRSPRPASDDGRPSPIHTHSGSPPLTVPLSASTPTTTNIAPSGHRPPPRYHRQVTLRDDSTTTSVTRTPMENMSIVGPHLITQLQRKAIRPAGPGDPTNPRGDPDATGRPIWAAHARAECRWAAPDGKVCGELLSRDSWRTHLLSVHGVGAGMRLRPTASTPTNTDVPANALRCRWAACELAPDGCATLSNLHKHIYNLHLALDWRECVLCLQVFARADACKRHFGRPGCLRNRAKHEKTVRRNQRDPSRQVWYPQFPLDRPGSREGIKDREVAEDSEGMSDSGMESDT